MEEKIPDSFRPNTDLEGRTEKLRNEKPKLSHERNMEILEDYAKTAREAYLPIIRYTVQDPKTNKSLSSLILPEIGTKILTNYVTALKILKGNKEAFKECLEITQKEVMLLLEEEVGFLERVNKKTMYTLAGECQFKTRTDIHYTYAKCQLEASNYLIELAKTYKKNERT